MLDEKYKVVEEYIVVEEYLKDYEYNRKLSEEVYNSIPDFKKGYPANNILSATQNPILLNDLLNSDWKIALGYVINDENRVWNKHIYIVTKQNEIVDPNAFAEDVEYKYYLTFEELSLFEYHIKVLANNFDPSLSNCLPSEEKFLSEMTSIGLFKGEKNNN